MSARRAEPLEWGGRVTISAAQARAQVGLEPGTLRKWVQRGKVRRYGRDCYDIDDIARELRARPRRPCPACGALLHMHDLTEWCRGCGWKQNRGCTST